MPTSGAKPAWEEVIAVKEAACAAVDADRVIAAVSPDQVRPAAGDDGVAAVGQVIAADDGVVAFAAADAVEAFVAEQAVTVMGFSDNARKAASRLWSAGTAG